MFLPITVSEAFDSLNANYLEVVTFTTRGSTPSMGYCRGTSSHINFTYLVPQDLARFGVSRLALHPASHANQSFRYSTSKQVSVRKPRR